MRYFASTKRAALVGGKRSTPTTFLPKVRCTPLDRVGGSEIRDRLATMGLDATVDLFETVTSGVQDIQKGDTLNWDGKDYAIRDVEFWEEEPGRLGSSYFRLILEKVKP